jgi:hypothetical protein
VLSPRLTTSPAALLLEEFFRRGNGFRPGIGGRKLEKLVLYDSLCSFLSEAIGFLESSFFKGGIGFLVTALSGDIAV